MVLMIKKKRVKLQLMIVDNNKYNNQNKQQEKAYKNIIIL